MAKKAKSAEIPTEQDFEALLAAEAEADAEECASELSARRKAHYDAICELNESVLIAGDDWEHKNNTAKVAKKNHELLQLQLSRLIARGPDPQQLEFPEDAAADAWKDVPISDALQLTDKQFEKLEAAGVRTVGQFENLRSGQVDGYPDGLRSIKGVGQNTVDQWEEQIVEWLSANAREPDKGESDVGTVTEEERANPDRA